MTDNELLQAILVELGDIQTQMDTISQASANDHLYLVHAVYFLCGLLVPVFGVLVFSTFSRGAR